MNFNGRTIAMIAAHDRHLDGPLDLRPANRSRRMPARSTCSTAGHLQSRGTLTNTGSVQVGSAAVLTGNSTPRGDRAGEGTVTGNVVFADRQRPPTRLQSGQLDRGRQFDAERQYDLHAELNGTAFGTQHDASR